MEPVGAFKYDDKQDALRVDVKSMPPSKPQKK